MSDSRLDYLFGKYFDKTATVEERAEFMEMIVSLKSDDPLVKLMETAYQSDHSLLTEFTPQIREKILGNVFQADTVENTAVKTPVLKMGWLKYAAAVVILLGFGLYFYNKKEKAHLLTQHIFQDKAPGGDRAILTLGNGKKIILDEAAKGVLVKQDNISISKTAEGLLVYDIRGEENGEISTNSIETPNGGQYQVNLPDGTKVWLNAGSLLKYPTRFSGSDRRVELNGEAYFEVTKNKEMPFKVILNKSMEVKVLGTHFNINAYTSEKTIRTTLLEGAVVFTSGQGTEQLVPGQQAKVDRLNQQITLVKNVDVDQVIAWKNGFFSNDVISLQDLMKEVARWYDVNVVYDDQVQAEFVAKLPRNVSLAELLRLLELTKQVHFKLDGKTLIVMK